MRAGVRLVAGAIGNIPALTDRLHSPLDALVQPAACTAHAHELRRADRDFGWYWGMRPLGLAREECEKWGAVRR